MSDDTSPAQSPAGAHLHRNIREWEYLRHRSNFFTRNQILELCVRASLRVPGHIVEFGVANGSSTRAIRRAVARYGNSWFAPHPRKKIYALDSFEGLREPFEKAIVGTFAGPVPKIPGVRFVKGYFEDTCNEDLREQIGTVAFAHLDADLFSSTYTALKWLTPMLTTGSLLLFDEFFGGDCAEQMAFVQWQHESSLDVMRVAAFDREPSGFGDRVDCRMLFQIVAKDTLPPRNDRGRTMWKLSYYFGRLGLPGWQDAIQDRL